MVGDQKGAYLALSGTPEMVALAPEPKDPTTRIPAKFRYGFRLRVQFESPIRAARLLTRCSLEYLHLAHLAGDAEVIISELATNALRHGTPGRDIVLYLRDEGKTFFLGIWDGNPNIPVAGDIDPMDESGRGLLIVASLSTQHGCDPFNGGKVMWARLCTGKR